MKKAFFIIFLLLIIAGLIFFIFVFIQKQEIVRLEESAEFLKSETVPVKFKIIRRTESAITFTVKFYDADGREIEAAEMTLKGQELSFDFITIKAGDKYISFPYKIFTDEIPAREGKRIASLYDQDGEPGIFLYKGIHPSLLNDLKIVFQNIKYDNIQNLDNYFGNLIHDIKKMSSFRTGIIYKIIVHVKGGIEVMEE